MPYELPQIPVLASKIAYREIGIRDAPIVVFLHGNPTSSFIWRNILPKVTEVAHCIAPDLIGFGQSGKPDIGYRFANHADYLDAFLKAKGITSAYVVAQDWGTALAFDLAARQPDIVRGLAFMEFIRPMPTWDDFHQSPDARELFKAFRTPGVGEKLIQDGNVFIERVLPNSIVRTLSPDEMATYRVPFPNSASRKPIWQFPNELPIANEPADVWARLSDAHAALRASTYPKVLFAGDPGALVSPEAGKAFAASLTNCRFVQLASGRHYVQEDEPDAIAEGIIAMINKA